MYKKPPFTQGRLFLLEAIVIREVFHNIFNTALENVAKFVDGINFHIQILAKTIDLRTVYIMMGIQIILCNAPLFHCLPQSIVSDHLSVPIFCLTFFHYGHKIEFRIVCVY